MPLGCHVNVPSLFWHAVSYLSRLTWKLVALDLHIHCAYCTYYGCGVANYYATKNVDGLEVNGVLLFSSLNVFQPHSCQNWKQKIVPRINESNYFANTVPRVYTLCTLLVVILNVAVSMRSYNSFFTTLEAFVAYGVACVYDFDYWAAGFSYNRISTRLIFLNK